MKSNQLYELAAANEIPVIVAVVSATGSNKDRITLPPEMCDFKPEQAEVGDEIVVTTGSKKVNPRVLSTLREAMARHADVDTTSHVVRGRISRVPPHTLSATFVSPSIRPTVGRPVVYLSLIHISEPTRPY